MSDLEDDYSSEGDDDYVPSGEASEGDSGDEEVAESGDEEVTGKTQTGQKRKQLKKKTKSKDEPRKRKGGIRLEGEEKDSTDITKDSENNKEAELQDTAVDEELKRKKKEEQEKKRADDLWSSFLSDVGQPKKAKTTTTSNAGSSSSATSKTTGVASKSTHKSTIATTPQAAKKETVTVTKVFDFAGEEVRVTEKVAANSKEAKTFLKKQEEKSSPSQLPNPMKATAGPSSGVKRPGGLSSVLGQLGKKSKLSTLEKSKLDWNQFKAKEGIEDELTSFVKGKSGYVEKQNFLARAEQRQYEQERSLRMAQTKILR